MTDLMLHEPVEATLVTNGVPVLDETTRLSRPAGFWVVAASLAAMTAFSTAPSALYGIYARQDHLSPFSLTIVYSVYAAGILASLLLVGHLSDWYGRRAVLVPAVLVALLATLVFAGSHSLPALLVGRVLAGVALGAAVPAATAWLTDLDTAPGAAPTRRSQIVATVANVGGLAVGPLLAGLLAVYGTPEPRVIALVFTGLMTLALVGTARAPEARPIPEPRPRYRAQRLAGPAADRRRFTAALTGDFLVFTVFGVFAGLASAFLSGTLHQTSPVLAGLAVFTSFGVGALTQVTTMTWPLRRLLALGIPVLIVGLAVVVFAAWARPPSLVLFFVGAALVGVGSGAIYRSTLTVVITAAPAHERASAVAMFFVVGYVGLSLPVLGAGVALLYVSLKVILLVFAIVVTAGILLASPVLLRLSPGGGSTAGHGTR
jgi:MFS family permease